jgi:microcystin-dependent protein
MSSPYLGEIRMFGGTFAPVGWHFCDGSLLPITNNDALYTLLGTTYGGDGTNTFGVPDLRGRVPLGTGTASGNTFLQGQLAGAESVTLTTSSMPGHSHTVRADGGAANSSGVTSAVPGTQPDTATPLHYVATQVAPVSLSPSAVGHAGLSSPVPLMQPVQAVTFIICTAGIFPAQN